MSTFKSLTLQAVQFDMKRRTGERAKRSQGSIGQHEKLVAKLELNNLYWNKNE